MTWRRKDNLGRETRAGMLTGWPNGWGWNDPTAIPPPGNFQIQRAGVPVTPHTSMQVDVVHLALRVIGNALTRMGDLRSYTEKFDKIGRPYKVWDNPQPSILSQTFGPGRGAGGLQNFQYDGRRRLIISLGLFGEAFTYTIERDYYGMPRTVEVLAPMYIGQERDKKKPFTSDLDSISTKSGKIIWTYGSGKDKIELNPDNLTHIPFMAFPGASRGLSAVEFGGINFALALAAMEYGQKWFAQGASPSFLLSTEQKLGPDEVKRIAETFLVEHSGLSTAHLPLVMDSGMKVEKISVSPDEAQFIATLDYARSSIAAWFGLPSHLVGGSNDRGNVWGKTVEEQGFQMVDFTLSGYTVPLAELHSSWLPRGHKAAFNEHKILRANAEALAALVTASRTAGIHSQNELRVEYFDLPPVSGGDELDVPLNSAPQPDASGAAAEDAASDNASSNSGGNI